MCDVGGVSGRVVAAGALYLCQRNVALVVRAPPPPLLSVLHPNLTPSPVQPSVGPEGKRGREGRRERGRGWAEHDGERVGSPRVRRGLVSH